MDRLSRQFYISKYHMMRRFKAETGYTIHGYLTEKRLFLAREKIAAGEPLRQVSEGCGFGGLFLLFQSLQKEIRRQSQRAAAS